MYKYCELNSEHNWETYAYIQLRNQQNMHFQYLLPNQGRSIPNLIFVDDVDVSHHKFPNATQISWNIYDQLEDGGQGTQDT